MALAVLALAAGCSVPPGGRTVTAPAQAAGVPPDGVIVEFGDATITRRIQAAYANEPTLQGSDITVKTKDGKVQLGGTVTGSRNGVRTAVKLALGVKGVQSVSENVRVVK